MTKKDYIKLAKLIKENTIDPEDGDSNTYLINWNELVNGLSYILKDDNPRFDEQRFIEACK